MPRPIHFEIHVANAERAAAFYRNVFGWTINKWEGPWEYYLIQTGEGPGIDGALVGRRGEEPVEGQPVNAWVLTMDVPSCDYAVAEITKQGGTIALPKMAIPGIGWLAYGKDTEGNIFGVMQNDPTAK
ncbi:MAG: VOC family protein [Gemmatimonadota bacterium]